MGKTLAPLPLTAQNKSGFAYKTIKHRLPVILVKTIDFLHRQRKELHKFGGTIAKPTDDEIKEIESNAMEFIAQLTKLRKEVETNKRLDPIVKVEGLEENLEYFNDDIELWDKAMWENRCAPNSPPHWFESSWLFLECYLYRRIKEFALRTKYLKMFDPFVEQKQSACKASLPQMLTVANHLIELENTTSSSSNHTHPSERSEFSLFMQLALWANKCDLSISGMSADKIQQQKISTTIRDSIEPLQQNILCDNISEIWFQVQSIKDRVRCSSQGGSESPIYIDLVADNAGYELFIDLCLLHFLTLVFCPLSLESSGVRFRIHLKRMPWFVSDALRHDLDWLLNFLATQDSSLRELGEKWKSFFASNFWEIHDHKFWTLSYDYAQMSDVCRDLYDTLSESSLIIFKGDLNYRKLVGDLQWHILTAFRVALRDFSPAPLVAIRTAKADVVVGIEDFNIFTRINNNEFPRDWMISGDYGLIQYQELLPKCLFNNVK